MQEGLERWHGDYDMVLNDRTILFSPSSASAYIVSLSKPHSPFYVTQPIGTRSGTRNTRSGGIGKCHQSDSLSLLQH